MTSVAQNALYRMMRNIRATEMIMRGPRHVIDPGKSALE